MGSGCTLTDVFPFGCRFNKIRVTIIITNTVPTIIAIYRMVTDDELDDIEVTDTVSICFGREVGDSVKTVGFTVSEVVPLVPEDISILYVVSASPQVFISQSLSTEI